MLQAEIDGELVVGDIAIARQEGVSIKAEPLCYLEAHAQLHVHKAAKVLATFFGVGTEKSVRQYCRELKPV